MEKGTYGTPSYANVQSYIHSTESFNSSKLKCNPVLLGKSACLRSTMPFLSAHFLLAALPFELRFVPSGNSRSHMGSRPLEPDSGPEWEVDSLRSR
jgi:hypothetical protein